MNNGPERFKEHFDNWNDVLRYMTEENTNLQKRVEKVLAAGNTSFLQGLERYQQRFERQDQVALLLRHQLNELIETATAAGDNLAIIPADFEEQLSSFKTDMDRVALLFSRLRLQFNRYMIEQLH